MRNCSAPLPLPVMATVRRMPSPSRGHGDAVAEILVAGQRRRRVRPPRPRPPARARRRGSGWRRPVRGRARRQRAVSSPVAAPRPPGSAAGALTVGRTTPTTRPTASAPATKPAPAGRQVPCDSQFSDCCDFTRSCSRHRDAAEGVTAGKRSVRSRSTMVSWATIAAGGGALTAGSTTVLAGGVIGPSGPRSRAMEMVTGMSMVSMVRGRSPAAPSTRSPAGGGCRRRCSAPASPSPASHRGPSPRAG